MVASIATLMVVGISDMGVRRPVGIFAPQDLGAGRTSVSHFFSLIDVEGGGQKEVQQVQIMWFFAIVLFSEFQRQVNVPGNRR